MNSMAFKFHSLYQAFLRPKIQHGAKRGGFGTIITPKWFNCKCLMGICILCCGICVVCAGNNPDPKKLLRGVESRRLQIPPTRLQLKYVYHDSLVTNTTDMVVDFDGEKRGFSCKLLEDTNETYKTVYDGARAITYDPRLSRFELRDIGNGNSMRLFDARTIGLSPYYQWTETLKSVLWYDHVDKLETLGRESIGENEAWHVRVTKKLPEGDFHSDYWIDDKNDFRVYRRDINGVKIVSYYSNADYPWLPSRVESTEYDFVQPEKIKCVRELDILQANPDQTFDATRWSIAGMGITNKAEVLDDSLRRTVGEWTGNEYIASIPEVSASSGERMGVLGYTVCVIMITLPIFLFIFVKRSNSKQ